ncbi:hypothetical protein C8A05DRAFT_46695 [Staphylotrichum tortipilum]|uniref:Uncharacterized protein n=1 Tax=Staphylotrichum tortipilum TaxID=2831512 RepID=A0AAN6ME59_9PEZI|nr:hypothetical protein C8A05DRAFT_46695 [Staphylotrichum longicolle]
MQEPVQENRFLGRSAPLEIIIRILQACHSTRDLLAFRANAAVALWPVWLCEIPHARDALIAVIVVEAEPRDQLPPTCLSSNQFQHPAAPTFPELKAVLELHRLSHAIANCIGAQDVRRPKNREGYPAPMEEPSRIPEWLARVDQKVFRLLILGASLAGAYQEPLFKAREHPDPARRTLRQRLKNHQSSGFWKDDLAFLMQFDICDLAAPADMQEALFGPAAEWLLDNILTDRESIAAMSKRFEQRCGRARRCLARGDHCPVTVLMDGGGSQSDAHLILLELMRMFWLHHARNIIHRRKPRSDDVYRNIQSPVASTVGVSPWICRAYEVMLPLSLPQSNCERLKACPAVPRAGEKGPLKEATSIPWPRLDIKFFDYFLWRHFRVDFGTFFFHRQQVQMELPSYGGFIESSAIFSHDNVEDPSPYNDWEFVLECADFLEGAELVDRLPREVEASYLPPL